ncbi:hypothetical protein KCU93_g190, partial [Aureobasidium melanogenum]
MGCRGYWSIPNVKVVRYKERARIGSPLLEVPNGSQELDNEIPAFSFWARIRVLVIARFCLLSCLVCVVASLVIALLVGFVENVIKIENRNKILNDCRRGMEFYRNKICIVCCVDRHSSDKLSPLLFKSSTCDVSARKVVRRGCKRIQALLALHVSPCLVTGVGRVKLVRTPIVGAMLKASGWVREHLTFAVDVMIQQASLIREPTLAAEQTAKLVIIIRADWVVGARAWEWWARAVGWCDCGSSCDLAVLDGMSASSLSSASEEASRLALSSVVDRAFPVRDTSSLDGEAREVRLPAVSRGSKPEENFLFRVVGR